MIFPDIMFSKHTKKMEDYIFLNLHDFSYNSGELTPGPSLERITCTFPEEEEDEWVCFRES